MGQKSVSYIGPSVSDKLPSSMKSSISLNTFRHDAKKKIVYKNLGCNLVIIIIIIINTFVIVIITIIIVIHYFYVTFIMLCFHIAIAIVATNIIFIIITIISILLSLFITVFINTISFHK